MLRVRPPPTSRYSGRHWVVRHVLPLREKHRQWPEAGVAACVGALWTSDGEAERRIVFAPAGEIVIPALRALERGGTVALAGIHMTAIPAIDYDRDLFGERVIRSVTANTKQDGVDLLREAAAIPIRSRTQRFTLEEANQALQQLKAGALKVRRVLAIAP